jgi:hypothetical protein
MLTRRAVLSWLFVPCLVLASAGCGNQQVTKVTVQVNASDTNLGINNATLEIFDTQPNPPVSAGTVHTDASGSVTFGLSSVKGIGHYQLVVSAAGYTTKTIDLSSTDHPINRDTSVSQIVTLDRSAPALVFHTYTGSGTTQSPQAATVAVALNNTNVFSDSTISVAGQNYDAVMVPNLKASTTYSYTVTASGFATVAGTQMTPANSTAAEVDVGLVQEAQIKFVTTSAADGSAVPATVSVVQGGLTFTQFTSLSLPPSVEMFAGLMPNTAFSYTVSASGFQTLTGTGMTGASGSTTTVNIALQSPTVSVQFQTSALLDTNGFPTSASITVSPGNFGTITTQFDPSSRAYDSATVGGFVVGQTYTLSVVFTQFTTQAAMVSFTPTGSSSGAPEIVQLQYTAAGIFIKALPQ